MKYNDFETAFIDRLVLRAAVPVRPDDVGRLLAAFPVAGGGSGCIVILVDDMVVRLVQQPGVWVAEHLVVRGDDY